MTTSPVEDGRVYRSCRPKEDHEPLHLGGVEDGGAMDSLPAHRGAFSLFTGDPWSVGDLLLLHHLPQPLEAVCQQTLDQPWDLTSSDGATMEKVWLIIQ